MLDKYLNKKLSYKNRVIFVSAILCGVLMGIVSVFAIALSTISDNPILGKLIYSIAFTAVLLLTVLNGYELFTGNTMLLIKVREKTLSKKILINLALVYVGNFIGCLLMALIFWLLGVHEKLHLENALETMYLAKTSLPIYKLLILGFFANLLVCMAVFLSSRGGNTIECYFGMFFPITIFCTLGFEHSIANMFSLFYSAFILNSSTTPVFVNLFFVTIGNILGGVAFALTARLKSPKTTE